MMKRSVRRNLFSSTSSKVKKEEHEAVPVIDLCHTSSSEVSSEDEKSLIKFSPVKPEITSESTKLKQVIPNIVEGEYHDPSTKYLPILARPLQGLTVHQLFSLIIGTIQENCICQRKPTSVTYSSVFVVDLQFVKSVDDLRADDNGVWVHGGKPRRKYLVERDITTSEMVDVVPFDGQSTSEQENVFTLVRLYHRHQSTHEFQRRISYIIDANKQLIKYAVVQYLFDDGKEVPVVVLPHCNAKKDHTSYCRTQKSTLSRLKEISGKPKVVASVLLDEAGGVLGASSTSQLPRNRRQIYNSQQCSLSKDGGGGKADSIFELIQQCKTDLMPGGRNFIRSVNFDSGTSCVLTTDSQLQNIVRFCSNKGECCVLGVDPTGKFYVTVTTYTYSHVVNKDTGKSPTFFGPFFVHTDKSYETFYLFFSTLLKLNPNLGSIIAVGTDGEQAIVKAVEAAFQGKVIQLRCFIHMKDNIRRKLAEFLLPEQIREDIIKDIFGFQQGTVYTKGLLDACSSSDFDRRLSSLQMKWDELEYSVNSGKDPVVYQWLLQTEADCMKSSMLACVRESAGLGSPPLSYTTNRNESMNNLAKSYTDYRQSSWVDLANNMFTLVREQSKEVEKAVIKMGEYRFKPAYKYLEVDSSKWFVMSPEQRQKHFRRVFSIECMPFHSQIDLEKDETELIENHLSIPPERSGITTISAELLEMTWKKAEKLLNTEGSICIAPGMCNAMCVASESGSRPHLVSKSKSGNFMCDDLCIAWKSQKLCSHVIAVSEKKECLDTFLSWHRGKKNPLNYTAVVTHNQSKRVGKKPGNPKRKGSSNFERPDIEVSVDPLPATNPSQSNSMPNVTANQIHQLNISPQSVMSSFHHSVYTSPSCSSAGSSPIVVTDFPFQIKFITPLIKICAGCRKGYSRTDDGKTCLPPPHDLCLVHKERHLYYNVVNGKQQLSSLSNVHYHANVDCPKIRFPNFNPHSVEVPDDIRGALQPAHWVFLCQVFRSN